MMNPLESLENYFENLSSEMILHIFSFLRIEDKARMACVSKLFNDLLKDKSLDHLPFTPRDYQSEVSWKDKFGIKTPCLKAIETLQDGRIAVNGYDGAIEIWKASDSQECELTLKGHTNFVCSLTAFSENKIASGTHGGDIKIWDLTKLSGEECVRTLNGHSSLVTGLCVLPGNHLVSSSRELILWDLNQESGNELVKKIGGDHSVVHGAVNAFSDKKIVSSLFHDIKVWDLTQSKDKECIATLQGHKGGISALTLMSKEKLVSGSHDGTIKVWDLGHENADKYIASVKTSFAIFSLSAINENQIVSGGHRFLCIWDLRRFEKPIQEVFYSLYATITSVKSLPDGTIITGSSHEPEITIHKFPKFTWKNELLYHSIFSRVPQSLPDESAYNLNLTATI